MQNFVYELKRDEGWDDEVYHLGTFSTIEKAKEYAEKDISTIKVKYRIDEDWSKVGPVYEKSLINEENIFDYDEYYINYTIIERELDPEYKED